MKRYNFGRLAALLILSLFLTGLLAACGGDETTPTTIPPTATLIPPSATALPPTATAQPPTVTATPVQPSPTALDADPQRTVAPVRTVVPVTPTPTVPVTADEASRYGPLPTPPRTLDPQAPGWSQSPQPLPKDSFVAATANGLFLLDKSGQGEKLIAGKAAFADPKVSPDGTQIVVFRTDLVTRQKQAVLMDTTGQFKPLGGEGGVVLGAAWSPDSKTLALTRATDTNGDGLADNLDTSTVSLYDVATGKQQSLGDGALPTWSPDGVRVAFVMPGAFDDKLDPTTHQPERGPDSLTVYNVTNQGRRDLISSKGLQISLGEAAISPITPDQKLDVRYFKAVTWHPDSQHITASADLIGPNGLRTGVVVTMTLADATPKVVTAGGDAVSGLSWANDGSHLAFETIPQYPVAAGSANRVALVASPGFDKPTPAKIFIGNPATRSETRRPLWLSDSSQVAFLEGDEAILTLADPSGQTLRHLISACTGYDIVAGKPKS